MKTSTKALTAGIVSLIIAGTSLLIFSAQADDDRGHYRDRDHYQDRDHSRNRDHYRGNHNPELVNKASLSAKQAMAIALADVPGKVTEVEIEQEDGRLAWRIEILNSKNQVYKLEIGASDGKILEKEQDDN